jgi:hypothetical protein
VANTTVGKSDYATGQASQCLPFYFFTPVGGTARP